MKHNNVLEQFANAPCQVDNTKHAFYITKVGGEEKRDSVLGRENNASPFESLKYY